MLSWFNSSEPSRARQVSLAVTLAWTDPPSNDGALVHDLDLEVLCDVSNWVVNLGNGGTSPDMVNNVEKVLLLSYESFSSVFCIAKAPVVLPHVFVFFGGEMMIRCSIQRQ